MTEYCAAGWTGRWGRVRYPGKTYLAHPRRHTNSVTCQWDQITFLESSFLTLILSLRWCRWLEKPKWAYSSLCLFIQLFIYHCLSAYMYFRLCLSAYLHCIYLLWVQYNNTLWGKYNTVTLKGCWIISILAVLHSNFCKAQTMQIFNTSGSFFFLLEAKVLTCCGL